MEIEKLRNEAESISTFGRGKTPLIQIKKEKLLKVLGELRAPDAYGFDRLEHLGAVERDSKIILSYFLQKSGSTEKVVVRTSLAIGGGDAKPGVSSITGIWRMGWLLEREIEDLYGVEFEDVVSREGTIPTKRPILPENLLGYPHRKDFQDGN